MMSHVCRKNSFSKQIFFRRLIMSVITNTLYGHPADDAQNASILHLGSLLIMEIERIPIFLKYGND